MYPEEGSRNVYLWNALSVLCLDMQPILFEPQHDKPINLPVRTVHWVLSFSLSVQRSLWSDWADVQADLSLRCIISLVLPCCGLFNVRLHHIRKEKNYVLSTCYLGILLVGDYLFLNQYLLRRQTYRQADDRKTDRQTDRQIQSYRKR